MAIQPAAEDIPDIAEAAAKLGIVGDDPSMRGAVEQAAALAPSTLPILILGETGTGKELLARLVHALSGRPPERFVPLNCATIPKELVGSILFGHKKGAFTGALSDFMVGVPLAGVILLALAPEEHNDPAEPVLHQQGIGRLAERPWIPQPARRCRRTRAARAASPPGIPRGGGTGGRRTGAGPRPPPVSPSHHPGSAGYGRPSPEPSAGALVERLPFRDLGRVDPGEVLRLKLRERLEIEALGKGNRVADREDAGIDDPDDVAGVGDVQGVPVLGGKSRKGVGSLFWYFIGRVSLRGASPRLMD